MKNRVLGIVLALAIGGMLPAIAQEPGTNTVPVGQNKGKGTKSKVYSEDWRKDKVCGKRLNITTEKLSDCESGNCGVLSPVPWKFK